MPQSTRRYDQNCEAIISRYLDTYFYALYDDESERVYDKERQCMGADVIVNGRTFIDEKVKLYPLNVFIGRLAFELQSKDRSGNFIDGWFVNPKSITTHYNIVTAFTYGKKDRIETIDDIEYVNILVIPKKSIEHFVYGHTHKWKLIEDVKRLRERTIGADKGGKIRKHYSHGRFYLTKSTALYEEPINLCIERKTLKELNKVTEYCVTRIGLQKVAGGAEPIVLKMSRDGGITHYNAMSFA